MEVVTEFEPQYNMGRPTLYPYDEWIEAAKKLHARSKARRKPGSKRAWPAIKLTRGVDFEITTDAMRSLLRKQAQARDVQLWISYTETDIHYRLKG